MEVILKYDYILKARNFLNNCPSSANPPNSMEAYKFVYNPINHDLNFLPNIIFDEKKGIPFDYVKAPEDIVCKRCGTSFYDTITNAKSAYSMLSPRIKTNLGYTHLAKGSLDLDDGLMSEIDHRGHFGLYESNAANFTEKFSIIDTLT